jgi:hypothetical protein
LAPVAAVHEAACIDALLCWFVSTATYLWSQSPRFVFLWKELAGRRLHRVHSETPGLARRILPCQLAVSGATPEDLDQQLQLIVSSLLETTQSNIEQLINRLFFVAGGGLMAGAIVKFKQHKNNPQQVHIGKPVAQLFIAAALLIIPSIFQSTGATLFGQ